MRKANLHSPSSSSVTDATGFVAVDNTNKVIVVSFRGTNSVQGYSTNTKFKLVPTDICNNCEGFEGYWISWQECRTQVVDAVGQALQSNPSYAVVVVGHSLGGALATFAAAHLRNIGRNVALVSFASLLIYHQW
jgi:pimeloyl-ACP methyl ester carboxylesterase